MPSRAISRGRLHLLTNDQNSTDTTTDINSDYDDSGTDLHNIVVVDGVDAINADLDAVGASAKPEQPTFAELGVDERIVSALAANGIVRTFAIQELTLPVALVGQDLIGQARTGMGKTLGFGVPLLQQLAKNPAEGTGERAPRALVIVPTRELCVQVTRDLASAAKNLALKVISVYGGRAYEPQIADLQKGVDVVIGTPGRLLDLAKSGNLVLGAVQVLVLDEADEMLDLGFLPDIEKVLTMVPEKRQTMLFSATMPGPILTLARTFMNQPMNIRAEAPAEGATHRSTTQFVYRAHAMDKVEMLSRVLNAEGRGLCMVFTRTKRTAQKVSDELVERGFASAAVHGDLGQGAREQALRAFTSGKVDVLVATDVAARGIDVPNVTHVVNYQCPEDDKTYVHRIGRTGRAGRTGVAVSFVDWDDIPRWKMINDALGLDFADPAETYSSSPHLYSDLSIPTDAKGRLARSERTRAGLGAEAIEDLGETGRGRKAPRSGQAGGRSGSRDNGGRDNGSRDNTGGSREGSAGGRTRRRVDRSTDTHRTENTSTEAGSADKTAEGSLVSAGGTGEAGKPRRRRRRRVSGAEGGSTGSTGTPAAE
ncbi:DEAD/DEAH box helicase [Nakamurella silvestris]|nr:DEAD/DEAH box helicase [Nakamurella silvestris]